MTDILVTLGLPALVAVLLWLALARWSKSGAALRVGVSLLLPSAGFFALAMLGSDPVRRWADLLVLSIAAVCQLIVSGAVLFFLERRRARAAG